MIVIKFNNINNNIKSKHDKCNSNLERVSSIHTAMTQSATILSWNETIIMSKRYFFQRKEREERNNNTQTNTQKTDT